MIRGEHDGNSTNDDLLDFYRQLPNGDRQFVILPQTAHSLGYSKNRHLLWYAVKNFLAAPLVAGGTAATLTLETSRRIAMKIVQGDELEWVRGLEYRGGTFHYRNLMEGTPGTIDNFQLSMGRNDKDFVSPRHRHNFEQFRFQLEGDLNFDRDGKMTPGMLGYFPEGASYGPQTSEATAMTIVLQFGGPSGSGYLSRKEVNQGMAELRKSGTFEAGVYKRNPDAPGKRNMDGFQAIWEHMHGRPLQFPKPRYAQPIMMNQAHYEWVASSEHAGVAREAARRVHRAARARPGCCRLAPGATLPGTGRGVYFVWSRRGARRRRAAARVDHGVPRSRRDGVVLGRQRDRDPASRPARPARHVDGAAFA